jgi:hypothetical protein
MGGQGAMGEAEVFVGIDVSKDQLDVAVRPEKMFFSIYNDDSGIKATSPSLS